MPTDLVRQYIGVAAFIAAISLAGPRLAIAERAAGATAPAPAKNSGVVDRVGIFKSTVQAESLSRGDGDLEDPAPEVLAEETEPGAKRRGEPFIAPIPFRSPSIGWGGALAVGYIFHIDPEDVESPPSTVAVAGFGTENESFGGVLSGRLHIAEDLWRVNGVFASTRVNYDFFGIGSNAGGQGSKIEIEADIIMGRLQPLRRLPEPIVVFGSPIYLGPSIAISRTENTLRSGSLPPTVSASELNETRIGYGVRMERDSRNDNFYPTDGNITELGFELYDEALGSDFSYRAFDGSYRRYDEIWPEGILATRVFGRFVEGKAAFSDLSQHDLRGYERGRYRDKMHLAGELELRQHLFWRFTGAAFTGLGQVAPDIDEFSDDKLLWSTGIGLRFQLTEQNKMNYRSDIAWGRDGFEFYFSITEAF
jgi:hypothetical protein